ncbi:alpha/beta hydrolase family protein [Porifericola rhodea]|uniref:alpha/beta hydrolase n=1 Tax=Porifericola rhodea TaxID=930972 RepID=UPI00266574F6|nr:alpha/beta hydrolase family protein [Porifericola rhodea]WKN31191.1 alpha/beta hydrolase family protein [Porifericola rhodea]
MLHHIASMVLLLLSFSVSFAQNYASGQVKESLKMLSSNLGYELEYSVYLPPDYETSSRYYPILYLLHGYTDDETAWVQFGEVNAAADEGIHTREIPPMIIVMPDGGSSFYIDDYEGEVKWESAFIEEFIPFIEDNYRVRKEKQYRAISGLSMGGYGSTILAMRHPNLFSVCVPFSSAYLSDEAMIAMDDTNYERVGGPLFGKGLTGENRVNPHWKKYSPLHLAETLPTEQLESIKWYIDCGDDDFLTEGNALMHITLTQRNVPHEFRMRDGEHNWSYWRSGIEGGLRFIGSSFHR